MVYQAVFVQNVPLWDNITPWINFIGFDMPLSKVDRQNRKLVNSFVYLKLFPTVFIFIESFIVVLKFKKKTKNLSPILFGVQVR